MSEEIYLPNVFKVIISETLNVTPLYSGNNIFINIISIHLIFTIKNLLEERRI